MRLHYTPLPVESKRCTCCGQTKPVGEFYPITRDQPRRRGRCKECYSRTRPPDLRKGMWHAIAATLRNRPQGGKAPTATALRLALGEPTRCYLCGDTLSWEDAAVDHVLPVSRGGTHDLDNLRWAHRACNDAKSALTVEQFCALARRILAFQAGQ